MWRNGKACTTQAVMVKTARVPAPHYRRRCVRKFRPSLEDRFASRMWRSEGEGGASRRLRWCRRGDTCTTGTAAAGPPLPPTPGWRSATTGARSTATRRSAGPHHPTAPLPLYTLPACSPVHTGMQLPMVSQSHFICLESLGRCTLRSPFLSYGRCILKSLPLSLVTTM